MLEVEEAALQPTRHWPREVPAYCGGCGLGQVGLLYRRADPRPWMPFFVVIVHCWDCLEVTRFDVPGL